MKLNILTCLFLICTLYSCKSNTMCFKLTQDFVTARDSGRRDFYVCKDSCSFFNKYAINDAAIPYSSSAEESRAWNKEQLDSMLFNNSPKVISEAYYKAFETLLHTYASRKLAPDAMVLVKYLDDSGTVTKEAYINKSQFLPFLKAVTALNSQYNTDAQINNQLAWFFEVIKNGVEFKGISG